MSPRFVPQASAEAVPVTFPVRGPVNDVACRLPVCTHAPDPLFEVIPVMPVAWPPVIDNPNKPEFQASLVKPSPKVPPENCSIAILLFAVRLGSLNTVLL